MVNEADALKCLACEADRPDYDLPPMGSVDAPSPNSGHFLPPTAGGPGSSVLPPTGTMDFGSGTLPPQGTLSPNAVADLMLSPPSRHPPPTKTPHGALGGGTGTTDMFGAMQSLGQGGYESYDYDSVKDVKGKKQKKSKKEKDLRDDPSLQDMTPPGRYQDRAERPEDIPTYAPTGVHSGTAFQGELVGGRVLLRILRAYDLRNTDLGILPSDASDPFAVARIGSKDYKTHVVENSPKLKLALQNSGYIKDQSENN